MSKARPQIAAATRTSDNHQGTRTSYNSVVAVTDPKEYVCDSRTGPWKAPNQPRTSGVASEPTRSAQPISFRAGVFIAMNFG